MLNVEWFWLGALLDSPVDSEPTVQVGLSALLQLFLWQHLVPMGRAIDFRLLIGDEEHAFWRDAKDLANGIRWVLDEANGEELTKNALHKVHANYSQTAVAMQYIEVYNHAAAFKNYKI